MRWSRRELGGVLCLGCEIHAPLRQAAEVMDAVPSAVAEAAAGIGFTVGSVGLVTGEEPRLVAVAPRRDIVAPLVLEALAGHAAHPRTHLWLALAAGTYLASVVDPYRPFSAREEDVASIVIGGNVACALTTERIPTSDRVGLRLRLYCSRPELRRLLRLARNGLEGAPGRLAAR